VTARPSSGRRSAPRRRARRGGAGRAAILAPAVEATAAPATADPEIQPAAGTTPTPEAAPADRPAFAHASEAEMARILDFYDVRWEYEPHTFPIMWNLEGEVVESFSPDFWLPDLDLYLEMTTLRQKLVRKKNRKLRRVLELYPDLNVKLFYARDFRQIMLKYGMLALADEMSGSSGQVVPYRPPAERIVADTEGRPT
jgi:hypoxanthine phosphoribosyltransferase